jgi:Tfp pilus assembly protein PilW
MSTRSDDGISLIELLVYMMLSILVLLVIGGLLRSSLTANRTVTLGSQSASSAQIAAQSLTRGIHNASDIEVGGGGLWVMTRSMDSLQPGMWRCEAWAIEGGDLRWTTSSSAIPAPGAGSAANWPLLASGVKENGQAIFTKIGRSVQFVATVGASLGDVEQVGAPITINTTLVPKQPIIPAAVVRVPSCF